MRIANALLFGLVACRPEPIVAPTNHEIRIAAAVTDRDGDGIPDDRDRCPDQAEDFDAYQDEDGCPDPDDDGDGVPDDKDHCPYTAGPGPNGCPSGCILVTDTDDCWADNTIFIDAAGLPQAERIHDVLETLRHYPDVRGITIEGNREASEPAAVALERAKIVHRALVGARSDVAIDEVDGGIRQSPGHAVRVRITKQRFAEGRFRSSDCTWWGPVYKVAKLTYHCP